MALIDCIPYRAGWLLSALSPALLATAGLLGGTGARPLPAERATPALAFDQYMIDLREVPPSPEVYAHFGFRNTSDRHVAVTALLPSCGCLQPQLKKRDYEPGDSGGFLVRIETANQEPGPHEYRVTVQYNDPDPQERELTFKVTLPQNQVVVRPRALAFYQFTSAPTDQLITVSDFRAQPLRLIGVRCNSDLAEVSLVEPGPESKKGELQVRVHVAGAVPPGRHDAIVTIFTDDPQSHTLHVPLRILGPEEGSIQLIEHTTEKTRR